MPATTWERGQLADEARAMGCRLGRLKPFVLTVPAVPAAAVSPAALGAMERHLRLARRKMGALIQGYLQWLDGPAGRAAGLEVANRRLCILKLRFGSLLAHLDIFAEVLLQRTEHEIGISLAGLDAVAADALRVPGAPRAPSLLCYLDRSLGAAIRRAHTPMPGGGASPVGIIRIPRERMVGSGLFSSLAHEVGHQGAALLGLLPGLQDAFRARHASGPREQQLWSLMGGWVSEMVADLWALSRLGISATLGLMGVLTLPRSFVFRLNPGDPHPPPALRVRLSCLFGQALHPHSQWDRVAGYWKACYPPDPAGPDGELLGRLAEALPECADRVLRSPLSALPGGCLGAFLRDPDRSPEALDACFQAWGRQPERLGLAPPCLAVAAVGQARFSGLLPPEEEADLLSKLLAFWAARRALAWTGPLEELPPNPALIA